MAVPIHALLPPATALAVMWMAACSALQADLDAPPGRPGGDGPPEGSLSGDRFPDVLAVELRARGDRIFDVVVTLSSPYDSPQRYADGWRVMDRDGTVLGTHTLRHDHANEQPFTRTQAGLRVPDDITEIAVQGRDQLNGYGGQTVTVMVPES